MNESPNFEYHAHAEELRHLPAHIVEALDEVAARRRDIRPGDLTLGELAVRMAAISAREAAWWEVLARWTIPHADQRIISRRTVLIAEMARFEWARFWRWCARSWSHSDAWRAER